MEGATAIGCLPVFHHHQKDKHAFRHRLKPMLPHSLDVSAMPLRHDMSLSVQKGNVVFCEVCQIVWLTSLSTSIPLVNMCIQDACGVRTLCPCRIHPVPFLRWIQGYPKRHLVCEGNPNGHGTHEKTRSYFPCVHIRTSCGLYWWALLGFKSVD